MTKDDFTLFDFFAGSYINHIKISLDIEYSSQVLEPTRIIYAVELTLIEEATQ